MKKFGANGKRNIKFFDYTLLFVVIFLVGFGLIMIYSTSSYTCSLSASTNYDGAYYLKKQLLSTILGLVIMVVVIFIQYHFWERFSLLALIGSIVLIFLVLSPLGIERNGARRWLNLGLSLQPAEVAKLGVILFLANTISKMSAKGLKSFKGFCFCITGPGIVAVLIYVITNNLSSAIIVVGIAMAMIFVASPDYRKFIIMIVVVAAAAILVVYLAQKNLLGFRGNRIKAWLDPESDPTANGFQTLQALYAIGSGGLFGKGLGQSIQKLGFIPEAQNDMIFSIICEEMGLFGAFAVIFLFIILIWRCLVIASNTKDIFGALLVTGVMSHFAIQVILNIAVVTNTIPNTGISLPFISYGGSSVLFLLIEIGLVLSVGRGIKFEEPDR